jgi:glycosyltransferase involved in cell wall biosynthesis
MSVQLSVVVSTFRRPQQLAQALNSALAQESVDLEVIVVDDSPECSAEPVVASMNDDRVRYYARPVPSGGRPALVRNDGWRLAHGQFVHFLDDDDQIATNAYRTMINAMNANPRRGVVFGRIEPFGGDREGLAHEKEYFQDGARRARMASRSGSRRWMVANMLYLNTPIVNSACMIRSTCLEQLGGYDGRLTLFEDVEFYIRAIRRFGCVFVDRVLLHYRLNHVSLMHGANSTVEQLAAHRLLCENYRAAFGRTEMFALKVFARTALRIL